MEKWKQNLKQGLFRWEISICIFTNKVDYIEKKDYITTSNTRRYYYNNNWQILGEYERLNNFKNWYAYGNYIDEILMMSNGTNFMTVKCFVHDHIYSPVVLYALYSGN